MFRPPMHTAHYLASLIMLVCANLTSAEEQIDFGQDVRPILQQHCVRCHGEKLQEINYRLDVRDRAMAAADFGTPPIVKRDAAASPLWR